MPTDNENKKKLVISLLNSGVITIEEAYLLLDNDPDIKIKKVENSVEDIEDVITNIADEIFRNVKAIESIDKSNIFDSKLGYCKN